MSLRDFVLAINSWKNRNWYIYSVDLAVGRFREDSISRVGLIFQFPWMWHDVLLKAQMIVNHYHWIALQYCKCKWKIFWKQFITSMAYITVSINSDISFSFRYLMTSSQETTDFQAPLQKCSHPLPDPSLAGTSLT